MHNGIFLILNNPCLFESGESTVLLDGLQTLHGDIYDNGLEELWYVNTAFLEVGLSADLARRVKLRRADTVRIAPSYLGAFSGDFAGSCHSQVMVA